MQHGHLVRTIRLKGAFYLSHLGFSADEMANGRHIDRSESEVKSIYLNSQLLAEEYYW